MKSILVLLLVLPAAAIDFPGQAPGVAMVQVVPDASVLSNAVLSARFAPLGESLKLAEVVRTGGGRFAGEADLFQITP